MPVRVLQLGNPTGLYGAERWILALVKHFDFKKVSPWVAAVKDDPCLEVPLCKEAEKLGIPSQVFEAHGRINLDGVRQLRGFIRQNGIHILHTHGYKTDVIGLLAVRGNGCKLVSTPHGWTKQADLKLWCYEMFNRCIFPFFDAVVPLSEQIYRPLQRLPGMKGKLNLIRNGVDISELDQVKEVSKEIKLLKEEGAFVIGYVGRLIPSKGLDVLLNAVAHLDSINWRLAIIGEGEQRSELEFLAQKLGVAKRVLFFGFRQDRISFLRGMDIFVLPSRTEGTPRCVMEAMAAGVPVVASDIPGCRTLVVDKKTGLLFPPDQVQRLMNVIKSVASEPVLRHSLAREGRRFVRSHFSAVRMAREYEELYSSISQPFSIRGHHLRGKSLLI